MIGSSTRARLLAIAISAATAALAARQASAQEGAGGLEEIIVTAERVEASLQETPIALSVFDAGTLDALGVIESGDIAAYTPNLRMDKTPASLNAYAIGIRGVASAEPSLAVDPTVGIYVDGVYLGRSSAAAFEVVDLERIEVLRGPQGTLYGRNTTGGAVNVVTAKPRREFGFTQELTAGERELLRTATSLDTGAFGDFAATLSFIHGERGGSPGAASPAVIWASTISRPGARRCAGRPRIRSRPITSTTITSRTPIPTSARSAMCARCT